MCGIAGIFNSSQSLDSLKSIGNYMSEQMQHRGPDSSGVIVRSSSKGGNVLLAHTRLSIIDLSNHGAQPMHWHDGKSWPRNIEGHCGIQQFHQFIFCFD